MLGLVAGYALEAVSDRSSADEADMLCRRAEFALRHSMACNWTVVARIIHRQLTDLLDETEAPGLERYNLLRNKSASAINSLRSTMRLIPMP